MTSKNKIKITVMQGRLQLPADMAGEVTEIQKGDSREFDAKYKPRFEGAARAGIIKIEDQPESKPVKKIEPEPVTHDEKHPAKSIIKKKEPQKAHQKKKR